MKTENDKAYWRAFILGTRTVVDGPHQIGDTHWEATLSDGSKWAEFGECSLLPGMAAKE